MRVTLTCYLNNSLLPATRALAEVWQPNRHSVDRMLSGYRPGDWLWRSPHALEFECDEHPNPDRTAWHHQLCDRLFRHLNADERPNGRSERSMSVGDLCAVQVGPYPARYYACEGLGWEEAERPLPQRILNWLAESEADALRREERQAAMLDAGPIIAEHRHLKGE